MGALPWIGRLHPQEFIPDTDASGPKTFQVMRQEKTLTLAWAQQACAQESGAPTGVSCYAAWELQKCMGPLMTLSGDDIVEASLLKPTQGKETKLLQILGVEPGKWITTPIASSPYPLLGPTTTLP